MLRIFKYLKKSIIPILVIIVLLAIQAVTDLSLPEYTSKIVNVGIQQGGIDNAAPTIIREKEMNKILLFMNNSEKETVLKNYTLLNQKNLSKNDFKKYKDEYPALKSQSLYKLKNIDENTLKKLNSTMSKSIIIVSQLETKSDEVTDLTKQLMNAFPKGALPKNADIFDIFSLLPQEQRIEMLKKINDKFAGMSDSMIEQAATVYVKNEYKVIGINTDKMQNHYITFSGLKMLVLALIGVIASILVTLLSSRIAAKLSKKLREEVFTKVINFSNNELNRFSTASLITRSTNDIQQVQMMMMLLFRIVIYAPILGVGAFVRARNANSSMEWVIGIAILIILFLVIGLFSIAMPRFKKLQQLIDRLNLVSREILTGLTVIRAFGNEKHEEQRFDDVNRDLTRISLFVNRIMTIMMPTMMLIMNGITVLIVWVGAGKINAGSMQVGDLMAFIQYTIQIVMAFIMISIISIILPRASVSAKRILEVLDTEISIKDPENPQRFDESKRGYVEFKDVSFKYPYAKEEVLSHISFTANPGETTAIIGSTGSGKSTIINLIPRFFDVTEGEVLVSGVNVKNVKQHDLRDQLGFVPQKGILFSGTVESNVKYGKKDASAETIKKAVRIAQATDFVESKPDKYQSEISQGGDNVSGGQKQRLSIARAIAKNPDIYVFDDSFSALDFKTDAALRHALKKETQKSTVIIVAQRISTVLHAEQIIVLDEGKIVGKGTHHQLMKDCEIYRQIALSQLSKEELTNE